MEQAPMILVISQTRQEAGALETALVQRYVEGYRITFTAADADPLNFVRLLRDEQAQVALLIYEGANGADFLSASAALYPEMARLLLDDDDSALDVVHLTAWTPPETHLYPVIDELLAEWRASVSRSFSRVSGIMTVRVVRVRLGDSLHRAAEVIALSGVGDLMVIDNDNNFVGVLSVGDVLRAAMPDFEEITGAGGTLEQAFRLFLRKGSELMYQPIAPLVIAEPLVVDPDDHVAKAAALMLERNIHRLPVVKDGRLVGTVGRTDICQAVVGTLLGRLQMVQRIDVSPARIVLENAVALNDQLGHDNLGSLSYSHGFLPRTEPLKALPASHAAWDQIAAAIPALFRTYTVREAVAELPILSADDLPDASILRASSLFSILAHLYWYSEPQPPANGIPPQIQRPWDEITRRLDRPAPHLSFIDLNSHNWHFIDPTLGYPFAAENLKLAIPMAGNEDERRFQMTPVELLYQFAPLMDAMLTAQEAALHDDPAALKGALVIISEALRFQTFTTLMKVNPNPYSDQYINPVVWGKTAALFASPFQPNNAVPGPSGTAIPSFTSLDIFFGRKSYRTNVGTQTERTRDWFPKHWRDWLDALETVSVGDYVAQRRDSELKGIYDEARDVYAGENGMLSRHRLKAYGFLDLSFKAGRSKTLGGTSGSYSERVWDRMATELDEARLERYGMHPQTTHLVNIKRVDLVSEGDQPVTRIVFDIAHTGIRYQAGDRCGILPKNSPELVEQTLQALRATGDEIIHLNEAWRWHVNLRDGYQQATELPLRTLLEFGRIRPVSRAAALHLFSLTHNERLRRILDAWAEDQWELWDLLDLLAESGYNPRRLWKAIPGDTEHICRVVAPERWRLYSISSVTKDELHLTIGGLHYRTQESEVSRQEDRWGTGSGFLARLCAGEIAGRISIKVVHPPRFSLPADPSRPVVLFAGGTGIAPMLGLIEERAQTPGAGATYLFFGTRSREEFYYQHEFELLISEGKLQLITAFSRDDVVAQFNFHRASFDFVPGKRRHLDRELLRDKHARLLWDLLRSTKDGGQGAYFYLCGRVAFASTMIDSIQVVIGQFTDAEGGTNQAENGRETLYRLIGEDRFLLEIFTTYAGAHFEGEKQAFNISDVVLHNDDAQGYWIIVSGRVYDMNRFNYMHPGGAKIIQSYSGMDATIAYQKVEHHVNSEVDAMLGMYELGVVRTPNFGQAWGVALSPKGLRMITLRDAFYAWVDVLYMIVEIENAVLNDFRIRHEPFTDIETRENVLLTPSKAQQLGLAHERLVTNYLDHVLGAPMETLWSLTIGLLGQSDLDVRWMGRRLSEIRASEAAQEVSALGERLREMIKGDGDRLSGDGASWERQYGAFCDALEAEDRRLMRDLKLTARAGVMVFEELEQDTIRQGVGRILAVLQAFPDVLAGFYKRLHEKMATVEGG